MFFSCTPGFQAFSPNALRIIFENAQKIIMALEGNPQWGFDGAMVLAACLGTNIPVSRISVPAMSLRDRPTEKIGTQFVNALSMCLAAQKVFGK